MYGGRGKDRVESSHLGSRQRPGDEIHGGAGDDTILGWRWDHIFGGPGDDSLFGVKLHGGRGSDYCADIYAGDSIGVGCDDDRLPPSILYVRQNSSTLEMTDRGVDLKIAARLSDDICIEGLQARMTIADPDGGDDLVFGGAWSHNQVWGTSRLGAWRTYVSLPVGSPEGTYRITVHSVSCPASEDEFPLSTWTGTVEVTNDN